METNNKTAAIVQEKDKNQVSLDLMHRMKLHGMAAAFTESMTSTVAESMMEKPSAFDPRGQATLTPENFFILTPLKS